MNIHKLFNEWNKVTDTVHFSKEQIAQLIHLIKLVMLDEYESFYIIDYSQKRFVYVHDNPLFLCGHSAHEVQDMGYKFYARYVHPEDIPFLFEVNEIGFRKYQELSKEDRNKDGYISYDFRIKNRNTYFPIRHTLIPLIKNKRQEIVWALCKVSLTDQERPNMIMAKVGEKEILWNREAKCWDEMPSPQLSEKEKEIVRLSIQGFREKDMSENLQLSESAIKKRKKILFQKLHVKNMSEAIVCCTNKKLF